MATTIFIVASLALSARIARSFELPGEISGYVAGDSRVFFYDEALAGQRRENGIADAVLEPEWYDSWHDGTDAVTLRPFFRADSDDTRRTHFDLRQFDYLHVGDGWEARVGIGKVFWGVAESAHLVDIINQTDAIEDVDREDKLGQPMIHLTVPRSFGTLEAFLLPGFRVRTFPGENGRLRSTFVVDQNHPEFDSDLGRAHVDFALRWSHTFDNWQVAVSDFYGTGRDPRFRTRLPSQLPPTVDELLRDTRLIPIYDIINQTGLETQYTGDNLLLKLEAISRTGQGPYRFAAVGGFEYTFYAVFGSSVDAGVLGEILYDTFDPDGLPSRSDIPSGTPIEAIAAGVAAIELKAAPSPFEHDAFFGTRLAFNDAQSTQVLAGGIVDVVDGSRFWTIEASRRLGERFSISADLRIFDGLPSDSYFHSVVRDDFLQMRISYYL